MDNINGALAFKATLDINDFNVSAQAMERSIKQVSSTAVSESSVMDNSIQSLCAKWGEIHCFLPRWAGYGDFASKYRANTWAVSTVGNCLYNHAQKWYASKGLDG